MPRFLAITAPVLVGFLLFAAQARAAWVWPLSGEVITRYSNGSDPYASGQHRGIDIAGEAGAAVVAAAGGEVRFAGTAGSSGLTVGVRSADGYDTSYLHLSTAAVRAGDRVEAGQRIGAVGVTGTRSAERPHLHFGVRDAGSRHAYHDPLGFLPPPAGIPGRPREAPAPQPAPVPLTPGPTPEPVRRPALRSVPAPRRAPEGRRVREPRRVPAGRRVRHPERVPTHRPAPSAEPAPVPSPFAVPRPVAAPAPAPIGQARPRPAARPLRERQPDGQAEPTGRPAAQRAGRPSEAGPLKGGAPAESPTQPAKPSAAAPGPAAGEPSSPGSGPGLGWALACVGLLLAAALLGLSEDGRKASRKSRDRVMGMLRPLVGRR